MNFMSTTARFGSIVIAALLAVSCTVVVDEPPRPGPIRPGPEICPQIYDPVCGGRGPDRQTFANACQADAAGYRVIRGGECRRGPDRPGRPDWDRPGRPDRPDRQDFCTREFRPVCARQGGRMRTFGNACEAEAAGFRIVRPGQC